MHLLLLLSFTPLTCQCPFLAHYETKPSHAFCRIWAFSVTHHAALDCYGEPDSTRDRVLGCLAAVVCAGWERGKKCSLPTIGPLYSTPPATTPLIGNGANN